MENGSGDQELNNEEYAVQKKTSTYRSYKYISTLIQIQIQKIENFSMSLLNQIVQIIIKIPSFPNLKA